MGKLQKALQEKIAELPRMALEKILTRKLKDQDVEFPLEAFEALLDHILDHKEEDFFWSDGNKSTDSVINNLKLSFDESDVKELQSLTEKISGAMPEIIEEMTSKSATNLFKAWKENWAINGAIQRYELDDFQSRLEERWSEGLGLLRMLLEVVREIGYDAAKRYRRSKAKKYAFRRFVLLRLHPRACQVADEIITLMENGFADGAMARWRTLHELDVVATLIEDGDEDLAQRYIDHDVVEVKKQADDYDKKQVPLGYDPIPPRERKKIEKEYAAVIQQYGPSFRHEYGWAANYLNDKKPNFRKLQDAADQSGMNAYYKLANFHIHAGARAMFFRLSDLGGIGIPIIGRSNAGLVEPGQNTAFSLVRVTAALIGRVTDLDKLVEMRTIIAIRDAIPKALHRADRKLRREEAKAQKDRKHKATDRRRKAVGE